MNAKNSFYMNVVKERFRKIELSKGFSTMSDDEIVSQIKFDWPLSHKVFMDDYLKAANEGVKEARQEKLLW